MPNLKVTITIEEDNRLLPGFPIIRRYVSNQADLLAFQQATGVAFATAPGIPTSLTALNALYLTADQATAVRFNNAGVIPLNANGMIIILDANVTAAPVAEIQNNSGSTANIKGMIAGT